MAATTGDRSIGNSMMTSNRFITINYERLELINDHSNETQCDRPELIDALSNEIHHDNLDLGSLVSLALPLAISWAPLLICCSQPIIQSFPFLTDHEILANVALFVILGALGLTLTYNAYKFGQGSEHRTLGLEAKCTVSFIFVVIGSFLGLDAVASSTCDTYSVLTLHGLLGLQLQFHWIGTLVWRFVDINPFEVLFDCVLTTAAFVLASDGGVAPSTAVKVAVCILVWGGVKRSVYLWLAD